MRKVQNGDTVRVHFTAALENGTKIGSTIGEKPMELTIGDRKLIGCFEQSVVGMAEGEKRTVHIEPKQAMGERRPELVYQVNRNLVPEQHEDLKIGSRVKVEGINEGTIKGRVTQLSDQQVTIDANHPLAGKTLIFDVELIGFI
jgi:FKBP-type peptidyl-prolyl cis-trans isomerase 2